MSPHDMHGKCFPRWIDCVTIAALNPTTIDVFCLDVMLHVISPKRGESTRQTLPSTTFQFLHARLDHLIQVCINEIRTHSFKDSFYSTFIRSVMLPSKNVHFESLSSGTHMLTDVAGESGTKQMFGFHMFTHRGGRLGEIITTRALPVPSLVLVHSAPDQRINI